MTTYEGFANAYSTPYSLSAYAVWVLVGNNDASIFEFFQNLRGNGSNWEVTFAMTFGRSPEQFYEDIITEDPFTPNHIPVPDIPDLGFEIPIVHDNLVSDVNTEIDITIEPFIAEAQTLRPFISLSTFPNSQSSVTACSGNVIISGRYEEWYQVTCTTGEMGWLPADSLEIISSE
jgi:hypothetical protein